MRWSIAVSVAAVLAIFLAGLGRNPPAFNFDESSVAYNAYTISREGRDEHGARFPLFFKAFGEFKNPVFIYLLAGAFTLVEPSTVAARAVSALAGVVTVLAIAWLAWRATRSHKATLAALLAAAATPMLFELSRLVFEATLFPLAVTLFLLAARAAHDRDDWSPSLAAALAATLALVTYTYTAGRLLGPLFALLLAVFVTRRRLRGFILTLILYALSLVPAARALDALLQHPRDVALHGTALDSLRNFALNVDPVNLAFFGDPNARHHVPGSGGSILLMTILLAILGAHLTWRDRWTTFLLFGLFVSFLPGALAQGVAHTLRLSACAVFLLALGFPAMAQKRRLVHALFVIGALQAAWFFAIYHRDGANRPDMFDAGARPAVEAAVATGRRPIYVEGRQYSHALWFGALAGVERSELRLLAPGERAPNGAVVYSDTFAPREANVLARHGRYTAFIAP